MSAVILKIKNGSTFRLTSQPGSGVKLTKRLAMGAQGVPGSVWRSGTTVPSNGLGIDGDFYFRTTNGAVYQKTAGMYNLIANLTGPAGPGGAGERGIATGASFTGTPMKKTITLATPMANTNYVVLVAGPGGENARVLTIEDRTTSGFVINSNAAEAFVGDVMWKAETI